MVNPLSILCYTKGAFMRYYVIVACLSICIAKPSLAQRTDDVAYGDSIKTFTTDPRFVNELVDHLPASEKVPSPLDYFGTIIGSPGRLHYTSEIYGYLHALADASPRVMVRSIGITEEGREMIEVIVADKRTLNNVETFRGRLNRLADPRGLDEHEAEALINAAKPVYYITAGLHSPETGPPEMVMELAYRLAVENSPMIQTIRNRIIFVFTPVAEPDGRDRVVDTYRYRADHRDVGPPLVYWGHYVAHDNNRDGFGLGLNLTHNILASFLYWKPQVLHDLHESVSYLYTSTGLGPYNEYLDPITIDEWHNLAHEEVSELTRRDMPGVWTHGFYNGWAANYLIWIANTRNSTGRFYETFGNSIPDTKERKLTKKQTSREWYRSNPPLKKAMWSLRNNTNYMESGVLVALKYTADHSREFVENFYLKSRRAVEKGRSEAPYAWVIPQDQRRTLATINLVNLLMEQGLEVHQATEDLSWNTGASEDDKKEEKADKQNANLKTVPKGAYVVRLDQPYRTLARVLLDRQNFPKGAKPPYDDTGWTLPLLHQVEAFKVDDSAILNADMKRLTRPVLATGRLENERRPYYLLDNTTDDNVSVFRFRLADLKMAAAEASFEVSGKKYHAGSFIIPAKGNGTKLTAKLKRAAADLGLTVHGVKKRPEVASHPVGTPRVGLIHTWVATPQDAGWWRLAFDNIGIPYTYLSEQDLASTDLKAFDVLIMPRTFASPQTLVGGLSRTGDPIPWQRTEAYQNIGVIDSTDDVRRGMGFDGLEKLKSFIDRGGVFITEGNTAALPIDFGITRHISITRTKKLQARGAVVKTTVADSTSPIIYGYENTLPVYFNQSPIFKIDKRTGDFRTPDWRKDEVWAREIPRVILKFAKKGVLMSGMLTNEAEMTGAPAVVDVPVGDGHVVLFANRPFRRWSTYGSHALVFNTMLHWDHLRTGWPDRPDEEPAPASSIFQE